MNIKRGTAFKPVVLTLESKAEAYQLLEDLRTAEAYLVNEVPPPRSKSNLYKTCVDIINYIEGME